MFCLLIVVASLDPEKEDFNIPLVLLYPMNREIIVLGDIEMGGGTLTDDFVADESLARLIKLYSRKAHPVELILNGDTFDFLKCPYIDADGRRSYPRYITAQVSLKKLQDIHLAHRRGFEALQFFLKNEKNKVTFIIGNHDHDLFFKEVQKELKKMITAKKNVSFGLYYRNYGLYAEHGQQYDFLNKINKNKPFITYRRQKILNIPWVALGIISNFLSRKGCSSLRVRKLLIIPSATQGIFNIFCLR